MSAWDTSELDRAGLNLQAVFAVDGLPAAMAADLRARFDPDGRYRQLILIGHAGKTLWARVAASGIESADPIDDFSVDTVGRWFARQFAGHRCAIIYPGSNAVDLQALGRIAGWHHPSPMRIGISAQWGTWYAYRVVLLADTGIAPTAPMAGESPCASCAHRICISRCPGSALDGGDFDLGKCVAHRKRVDSSCQATCLARIACPVGSDHRYCAEQIRHTYSLSMRAIERFY